MKKILLIVIIVVFVPFLIVNSYKIQKVKEIKLNYESNYFIRVKRTSTMKYKIYLLRNILLVF